ncbi:MAG: hypothetical protein KIS92_12515 [Planctomycetota bacterium]|nr:hypothetical protein [Planctomycetota bacterium]
MRIAYYTHAWQFVLMFLAGALCLVGSFVGYLDSGGGNELLQQALVSFFPRGNVRHGGVRFDSGTWSKVTVSDLRSDPIIEGSNYVKGLHADKCEIYLDLWPSPRIEAVHVYGIKDIEVAARPTYLQETQPKIAKGPPFPVYFHDINADIKIGDGPMLKLEECSGLLKQGLKQDLIGEFGLSKLNGKPFAFTVASLGDGRWETHGQNLEIDTQVLRVAPEQLGEAVDPVALLLRALLTGEMGAKGQIPALRVAVEPAMAGRNFVCEGNVAYKDLELRLPPVKTPAGVVVPGALNWMFFGEKSIWPPWLLPDAIKTGSGGNLSFHMVGNRLEFACDEGPGSAFIVTKHGESISLESLKGSIVTDEQHRPKTIVLRGILGRKYNGELRMERGEDGVRTFEFLVDPRATERDAPLWRFRTHVEDYSESLAAGAKGDLVKFEVELASQDSPVGEFLPPGIRDVSGRVLVRGRFASDRVMDLDEITWRKGALTYGGAEDPSTNPLLADIYGRVFSSLRRMWGGPESEWYLQDIDVTGRVRVRFDARNNWVDTKVYDWKLASGIVTYKGIASDFGAAGIELQGYYAAEASADAPMLHFEAGPKNRKTGKFDWSMRLEGFRLGTPEAAVNFIEDSVPLRLHPQRESIPSKYIEGWLDKSVKRTHAVRFQDDKPVLDIRK